MAKAKTQPEQNYHFFASTAFNWAIGLTRKEALAKLAKDVGAGIIAKQVKAHGGLYVWTCKVLTPIAQTYDINHYAPSYLTVDGKSTGVRVPTESHDEFRIVTAKGYVAVED